MREWLPKDGDEKLLALSDERKKFIEEYVKEVTDYELTLYSLEEAATNFIDVHSARIKQEVVPYEKAKFALAVISKMFEDKKLPLNAAIERMEDEFLLMDKIIGDLDERKFSHRIEKMEELRGKLKPHYDRVKEFITKIDERKREKLEEAKKVIMKGHRKEFLEKF